MTINAQNRSLPDWFTRVRTRQLVLPRFQRFESWSHSNVEQVFNTILRKLPVGAVLILEIGNEEPFVSRPIVGAPVQGERITEHLLDGQQRLTALWRGLLNNYIDRSYFVVLEQDDESGLPFYVKSLGRWQKEGDTSRRPFWADEPKELWKRRMIPLDLLAPDDKARDRYKTWAKLAIGNVDERENVSEICASVRETFMAFNLPFLSLPVHTSKDTALDVFMKMNTSAAPLTTYDIVVAQIEASLGQSLHDLVGACRQKCPAIELYYEPENLVLAASALLQEKTPTNSSFLSKGFGKVMLEQWDALVSGIQRTVAFLEEECIYDAKRLPSDVVVPVLVALWANAPIGKDAEGRARTIIRKYLWRAFFSSRYEKSTNTRTYSDYLALKKYISDKDASIPEILDSNRYPLPQVEELISARWPTHKDRIGRAILAIALRHGGLDLADGGVTSRANLPKREYHHLFPEAHLLRKDYSADEIYKSLNCALVTWHTNRNISDKDPERYIAERLDHTGVDIEEVKQRLDSHLIPYAELVGGDYAKFLTARGALFHKAMTKLCETGMLKGTLIADDQMKIASDMERSGTT